jgi:hypothetical protein
MPRARHLIFDPPEREPMEGGFAREEVRLANRNPGTRAGSALARLALRMAGDAGRSLRGPPPRTAANQLTIEALPPGNQATPDALYSVGSA